MMCRLHGNIAAAHPEISEIDVNPCSSGPAPSSHWTR